MNTQPNIPDPDGFYAAWTDVQHGMDASQSADYNARLVLLLTNQIGDMAVIHACIEAAKAS